MLYDHECDTGSRNFSEFNYPGKPKSGSWMERKEKEIG